MVSLHRQLGVSSLMCCDLVRPRDRLASRASRLFVVPAFRLRLGSLLHDQVLLAAGANIEIRDTDNNMAGDAFNSKVL